MTEQLKDFILEVIAYGGGSTAIAFLSFKFFGAKWLESKFTERLKIIEHGYAVELAKFKQRLEAATNGLSRIHQREFEVLPEAWSLLDEAMLNLKRVVSPSQRYTNVEAMSDEEWIVFLEKLENINPIEENYLIGAPREDRQREFIRLQDFQRASAAEQAIYNFQKYVSRHSIFLPEDLRLRFDSMRDLLWSASNSKSIGREAEDWELQAKGWEKLEKEADPLFEKIRTEIQNRISLQKNLCLDGLDITNFKPN